MGWSDALKFITPFFASANATTPPTSNYRVSPAGLALIKQSESLRLKAYKDPVGVWTIGWGTTVINGQPVRDGMVITEQQADQLLTEECDRIARELPSMVIPTLNQFQIDSLVDFMYNLGIEAFRRSTLRKVINSGQVVTEDLFTRWNRAHLPNGTIVTMGGLTTRRKAEYRLFTTTP